MAKKTQQKKIQPYNQSLSVIPILLLILIYPFLAKYNAVGNPLLGNPCYYSNELLSDIFLYVKSGFLLFTAIAMLCIYLFDWITDSGAHKLSASDLKQFLPLGIYAVFIILSTVFAHNTQLALEGMPGQYENMWTLLAYLIVCVFGYWYFKNATSHTAITYAFLGGSLVMGLLCLLQFLGADPYVAMFASKNAKVAVKGVYGGFFNPNYLGSYVNLILPLLIALLVVFRKKKPIFVLLCVTIALTVLGLLGSKTTGGLIGVAIVLSFTVLFLLFKKKQWSGKAFCITFLTIAAIFIFGICMFLNRATRSSILLYERLEAIYTNEDNLEIQRNGEAFYLQAHHSDGSFYLTCTDRAGHDIPVTIRDNTFYFSDERLVHFSVKPFALAEKDNLVAFELRYGDYIFYFTNDYTDDASYYYITPALGFVKTTPENTSLGVFFSKTPKFMSGRGYIWSQSIPMLADTLLIGYGPDSFAEYFPNHDFVAALRGGFTNTFISKPHNMYLQIALQTGIPSLLAFLAFYLIYFAKSVKLYLNVNLAKHGGALTGFGIFLGTFGYLVVGLINDSSLTVAPFFWLLMGIGYALNQRIAQEIQ